MSVVESSTGSPPPEPWAGKSRNAKAQARHRAKRKAYIEQLEHTVSKLQTALALSTEDVTNLPTTQMKLRELKEENDTLRAELQKLQMHSSAPVASSSTGYQDRSPTHMLSPVSSEEHLRQPKKRKVSPAAVDELLSRNLQAYLGPDDTMDDASHFHHSDSRQTLHVSVPPQIPPPQAGLQLQRPVTAVQPSPDALPVQQTRDALFSWRPFSSYAEDPLLDTTPISWPFSQQSNHHRQRSSSESSSSSISDPPYLAQAHTPIQTSATAPYKGTLADNSPQYDPVLKREENYAYAHAPDGSAPYSQVPMPLSAVSDSASEQNAWPDGAWSYSAVRMQ